MYRNICVNVSNNNYVVTFMLCLKYAAHDKTALKCMLFEKWMTCISISPSQILRLEVYVERRTSMNDIFLKNAVWNRKTSSFMVPCLHVLWARRTLGFIFNCFASHTRKHIRSNLRDCLYWKTIVLIKVKRSEIQITYKL